MSIVPCDIDLNPDLKHRCIALRSKQTPRHQGGADQTVTLVAVEEAFKNPKGDLAIRPIFHQGERRVDANIFIAFRAYCLQITLQRRLHALAPGLTARSALEKCAAVHMIDVHLPAIDGRELLLTRYQPSDYCEIRSEDRSLPICWKACLRGTTLGLWK
jgi:hypothetical protein